MKTALALALTIALFAGRAAAKTVNVPDDTTDYNSAVGLLVEGDTLEIGPGAPKGNIVLFQMTGITVKGLPGAILDNATGAPPLLVWDSDNIVVTGLTFAPTVFDGTGAAIAGARNVTFSKCTFTGCTLRGLWIYPWSGNCQNVTVSQCRFTNMGAYAIEEEATGGLTIEKCVIDGVTGTGIGLSVGLPVFTQNVILTGNRIENAGGAGILFHSRYTLIVKNTLVGILLDGIAADGAGDVMDASISKNTLSDIGGAALVLAGSNLEAIGNKISGAGIGIRSGGNGNDIEKNKITTTRWAGIHVVSGFATVTGNSVSGAGQAGDTNEPDRSGILVFSTGSTLTKNKVSNSRGHGFALLAGGNTLTGNSAKGSGTGMFDLFDDSYPATNTFDGNKWKTEWFRGS